MAAPVVCMVDGRAKLIGLTRPGKGAKRSQPLAVANVVGYKIDKAANEVANRDNSKTTETPEKDKNGDISLIIDAFCVIPVLINFFL